MLDRYVLSFCKLYKCPVPMLYTWNKCCLSTLLQFKEKGERSSKTKNLRATGLAYCFFPTIFNCIGQLLSVLLLLLYFVFNSFLFLSFAFFLLGIYFITLCQLVFNSYFQFLFFYINLFEAVHFPMDIFASHRFWYVGNFSFSS